LLNNYKMYSKEGEVYMSEILKMIAFIIFFTTILAEVTINILNSKAIINGKDDIYIDGKYYVIATFIAMMLGFVSCLV
jgi:hypothetical protein